MNDNFKRLEELTANLTADPYAAVDYMFENAIDLLCIVRTDGYFAKVSESFVRELGLSREHLLTVSFFDLMHLDDIQPSRDCWANAQAGKPTDGFKNRYKTGSGGYLTLVWSLPAIKDGVAFSIARIERDK